MGDNSDFWTMDMLSHSFGLPKIEPPEASQQKPTIQRPRLQTQPMVLEVNSASEQRTPLRVVNLNERHVESRYFQSQRKPMGIEYEKQSCGDTRSNTQALKSVSRPLSPPNHRPTFRQPPPLQQSSQRVQPSAISKYSQPTDVVKPAAQPSDLSMYSLPAGFVKPTAQTFHRHHGNVQASSQTFTRPTFTSTFSAQSTLLQQTTATADEDWAADPLPFMLFTPNPSAPKEHVPLNSRTTTQKWPSLNKLARAAPEPRRLSKEDRDADFDRELALMEEGEQPLEPDEPFIFNDSFPQLSQPVEVDSTENDDWAYGVPSTPIRDKAMETNVQKLTTFVADKDNDTELVGIDAVSAKFRSVFQEFPYFNIVQSKVFDKVYNSDLSVAVCAPTGSGKTAIMELAIVRWLEVYKGCGSKAVYLAPTKALCSQKFKDWQEKFGVTFGATCFEITGDTVPEDQMQLLRNSQIVVTTPEKWDSLTRKWKTYFTPIMSSVNLMLIDEVHLLSEGERGATLEVVVTRMKTKLNKGIRFIAVSATASNIQDVSDWLGNPGVSFKMDSSCRPVKLETHVLGYYCHDSMEVFRFDISLNYKVFGVIKQHWIGKPCLVFCSSRKGTSNAASELLNQAQDFFVRDMNVSNHLREVARNIQDQKLGEFLVRGVAFHHAGLGHKDRKIVEDEYEKGNIPVLFSTTTMALGVNLPAHLVIIKSTFHYQPGKAHDEYTASTINQMIGRAGRPQYGETTAVAVIMTMDRLKEKYIKMLNGEKELESTLHKNLSEHLNAEVVLHTITNINVAVEWIKSTFLFNRILQNPQEYDSQLAKSTSRDLIEKRIKDWCINELSGLKKYGMITMDSETMAVEPTPVGELMAFYCVSAETMKKFVQVMPNTSLSTLLDLLSTCKEFKQDITLRVSDKKDLFMFSDTKQRGNENAQIIRFPMNGKIKTVEMKINTLVQAAFGNFKVENHIFAADIQTIVRLGQRLSKSLFEVLCETNKGYSSLRNALTLHKCFKAELWENSPFVTKQLPKIGAVMSKQLALGGFTSFESIEERADARHIEHLLGRRSLFGNEIIDNVKLLPKYDIQLEQQPPSQFSGSSFTIKVKLLNYGHLVAHMCKRQNFKYHACYLLVGDSEDASHLCHKLTDQNLIKSRGDLKKTISFPIDKRAKGLKVSLISESIVGIDVHYSYDIIYGQSSEGAVLLTPKIEEASFPAATRGPPESNANSSAITELMDSLGDSTCKHSCKNKDQCSHQCCKSGRKHPLRRQSSAPKSEPKKRHVNPIDVVRAKTALTIDVPYPPNTLQVPPMSEITQELEPWQIQSPDVLDFEALHERPSLDFLNSEPPKKQPKLEHLPLLSNQSSVYFETQDPVKKEPSPQTAPPPQKPLSAESEDKALDDDFDDFGSWSQSVPKVSFFP